VVKNGEVMSAQADGQGDDDGRVGDDNKKSVPHQL
jgi:hypothetical protein